MESDSDVSLSPVPDETKEDLDPVATLKPAADQSIAHSTVPTTNGTTGRIQVSTADSAVKSGIRSCVDGSQKELRKLGQQQGQLNYMEPSNLDLNPITTSMASTTRAPNTFGSCVTNSTFTPVFPCDNGLSGALGKLRVGPSVPGRVEEDDRIEYREIDPISTNALAIVTKHYLDDDNKPL
ncbi:hypothetical protein FGIG_10365 [Fasciola gigantica]|uniref:Uncharacterized protein n=1 Tax=Fasciola gigantica TaxID=46835 RepID=A0A504YQ26_FASGI|nr:hypothetical protein FGIG_10365 [Fasciola gigantica]